MSKEVGPQAGFYESSSEGGSDVLRARQVAQGERRRKGERGKKKGEVGALSPSRTGLTHDSGVPHLARGWEEKEKKKRRELR